MKNVPVAVLLFSAVFSTGCMTRTTSNPFGEFRHTLLVPGRIHEPGPNGSRFQLKPPSETPLVRCQDNFRHPVLNRCETWPAAEANPPAERKVALKHIRFADPDRERSLVVEKARFLLSNRTHTFHAFGKSYRADCAGMVMTAYSAAGAPLEPFLAADAPKGESLVSRLYRGLEERGRVHTHKVPEPGDLVFFDNTFDRNRDGRANDRLTHVGIVETVKADGTVIVIHHARGGVLRTRLNLFHPKLRRDPKSGQTLNHYLRFADGRATKRLAGELFAGFATVIH